MNILFLIFQGFDPSNGISKKIIYQQNALKANGHKVHLCYLEDNDIKQRVVDHEVIADYGGGRKGKILKRIEFDSIVDYAIKAQIGPIPTTKNISTNRCVVNLFKTNYSGKSLPNS